MEKRNTQKIQDAILSSIANSHTVPSAQIASELSITVQTVYRNIHKLEQSGLIMKTKKATYSLVRRKLYEGEFSPVGLQEDIVYKESVKPIVADYSDAVLDCFSYIFSEILNNAIDHSDASKINIVLGEDALSFICSIHDNGIGIFNKISQALNLPEKRYAILELAKGKFTTSPEGHTGEGIFFSSKIADAFAIRSDDLTFVSSGTMDMFPALLGNKSIAQGTEVIFEIKKNRTVKSYDVFQEFQSNPDKYSFTKTIVPVKLLEFMDDRPMFISRSQAKRLLARLDRFDNIILDFEGINEIGQGFADEIFRIYVSDHPQSNILPINTTKEVSKMIQHVSRH